MKINLKYYPQYKDYSCGPAALRMVFERLGKKYTEEKMIALCKATPKRGTTHKDLIKEVKKQGFNYIERKNGKIKDLLFFLKRGYPVIVNYVNPLSKSGHYSVVCGYKKKEKLLIFADPSNGNDYTLSWKRFKKNWHNTKKTSMGWLLVVCRDKHIV